MHQQDWDVVTFKKKENQVIKNKQAVTSTSSVTNKPLWKIEAQIDSDSGKPLQYISTIDSQMVIQGRIAMKLTQKDLACRLNIQTKDIQEIESGKALENKLILSKIKKIFNITTSKK
jgi:ribosome-binding protein aMBF1 (putative translation factor)